MMKVLILAASVLIAVLISCESPTVSSGQLLPPRADSTSHDVLWQIDTLASNGNLYDVAIVNDTLIYAVGELHPFDSAGQFYPGYYSLAQWNGSSWQFRRLYYRGKDYKGDDYVAPLTAIYGIQVFSPTDIWLCAGSIFHWNGTDSLTELSFSRLSLTNPIGVIERLWGKSSTFLYGVGRGGSVVFFNGSIWQQIQTEALFDFRDVWGSGDEVLAVAYNPGSATESRILSLSGAAVTFSDTSVAHSLRGVWFSPGKKYFVVGDGVFTKSSLMDSTWSKTMLDLPYSPSVVAAGTDTNNVFVAGLSCNVSHYNGSSWKLYPNLLANDGFVLGLAIKDRLVVAVGTLTLQSIGLRPIVIKGVQH